VFGSGPSYAAWRRCIADANQSWQVIHREACEKIAAAPAPRTSSKSGNFWTLDPANGRCCDRRLTTLALDF
jgi:hypothetical protein